MDIICNIDCFELREDPRENPFTVTPTVYRDGRGLFAETWRRSSTDDGSWRVQENVSFSGHGVFRGMHAQSAPHCQGKLVTCVFGEVVDFIVDARPDSSTFGAAFGVRLGQSSMKSIWVPRGFLHGFHVTGEDGAVVSYACDDAYHPECGISVSPMSFLRAFSDSPDICGWCNRILGGGEPVMSNKDRDGVGFDAFVFDVNGKWMNDGVKWYADNDQRK